MPRHRRSGIPPDAEAIGRPLIEVHLAFTKFVTQYDLVSQKGDVLEITGVKVKFEGVDTIFARNFRDNDGKPLG